MPISRLARKKLTVAAVLAAGTLIVFWKTRDNGFINYDDPLYVTGNSHVQAGLSWQNLRWALTATDAANWHPVTWISHMADCQVYGMDPAGHHMTSLFLHAANVVVLFWLLHMMTAALWRSALVAALFAAHPLNVESVAWIAERKNVLSTLFFLLAIAAYVRFARRPGLGRYLAVSGLFVLGLMSKPMLVTLPFVLLLLDYWPLERVAGVEAAGGPEPQAQKPAKKKPDKLARANFPPRPSPQRPLLHLVLEKVPLLLLAAASSIITVIAQKKGGAVNSTIAFPLGVRLENAAVSYAAFLWKAAWPSDLAVFYPHPDQSLPAWRIGLAVIVLLAISAAVLWRAKLLKYAPVAWLWYLGVLVPVIGLVQVGLQARADRYAYIPLIGIFVLVVWSAAQAAARRQSAGRWLAAAAVAALIGFAIQTNVQLGYWRDSVMLFDHAVQATDANYIAYNNLGEALAEQGRLDEAAADFAKSIEANPLYSQAHHNLGMALVQRGKLDEAIEYFKRAIEINPDFYDAYNKLGAALASQGHGDEALAYFARALEINPAYASAYANLGSALEQQGRTDEAMANYLKALDLIASPAFAAQIDCRVGNVLLKQGKTAEAAEYYRRALKSKPDYPPALQSLQKISK